MWDAVSDGDHLYSFFVHMKAEGREKGIGFAVGNYFMQRLTEISRDQLVEYAAREYHKPAKRVREKKLRGS